ncbi:hypothetical protein HanXRQr2_Chr13g0592351 [Helianthus annuus]|uniref:Uncharacterized protein n=1 Tax=Helianthus annuus TaxID=4232 RepID=A0A9K3EIH4_HELAN|nr:hypothetical protein HanXRQr2_Chr13g0592351 [Helianthus annuus]KAJ0849581.1 hypothetical protein HanPSC8_Chr13g0570411 [Helianthus annuus]
MFSSKNGVRSFCHDTIGFFGFLRCNGETVTFNCFFSPSYSIHARISCKMLGLGFRKFRYRHGRIRPV